MKDLFISLQRGNWKKKRRECVYTVLWLLELFVGPALKVLVSRRNVSPFKILEDITSLRFTEKMTKGKDILIYLSQRPLAFGLTCIY